MQRLLSCGPTFNIKWFESWSSLTHTYLNTTAALWWKKECYLWGLDPPSTRPSPTWIFSLFCACLNPSFWVQPVYCFGCLTFSVGHFTAGYGTSLVGPVCPPLLLQEPQHYRCCGETMFCCWLKCNQSTAATHRGIYQFPPHKLQ